MPRGKAPAVSIVGPGRLGAALAINLKSAGWPVRSIVVRAGGRVSPSARRLARGLGSGVVRLGVEPLAEGLIWITVPDDQIARVATSLAEMQEWRGSIVFHSSGALTSDELGPLRRRGAAVASVHPGMTFVHRAVPSLNGVPFGVEGDSKAVRLAQQVVASLGGTSVRIAKERKVLYHAFDVFASPLLIALMAGLEDVGRAAGITPTKLRTMAGPLLRQTLENYLEHGAAQAFSGPFVRGDAAVIERHLEELKATPLGREAYLALGRLAVARLPVKNREKLRQSLHKKHRG